MAIFPNALSDRPGEGERETETSTEVSKPTAVTFSRFEERDLSS
jgi:hypothetical protein